ncbi:aldehyde dehydrogenase family protein [Gemmobacter fulvus]|uniref:Aldehyde dehydrogenase family protein n=1 Tax=Gemmobacter fulvus TaxID=2840474 RepID=A0A975P965_9RHOB|nr:aldehyde dehydrogenase family protein [Gemmobacter fulvus]MBT9244862.1 aldehyde dehydrogenase family protein [Gemmobacter fulvus]QWK91697.1 aldehyde dehydrogenase family protein [Gemmobacter fulvus]
MSELHLNLIAGQWVGAEDTSENRNPSDPSDLIGVYASGGADDVARAAAAAATAQTAWFEGGPQPRADLLDRIASMIEARAQEIGTMLAREEGKILPEALAETRRAAQIFRFYAGEALRVAGEALPSVRPQVDIEILRAPLGVVGLITPWNFPIAIPAWKIAPALAYGNAVVFKPADLTPGTAHLLAQIIHQAGCPAGVFNLVMGSGARVGATLVADPQISGISFTGSVPTGRGIARAAAETMKKVQLEMGGKNPMVVLDDADLPLAVAACLNGAFFSTGQRCTASSRLIVQAGIHDAFVAELSRQMQALRVGPALAEGSQIGPVVSAAQLQGNLRYVALARDEGCTVIGGDALGGTGYFQSPALFLGADPAMRVAQEEIFGPCAAVIKVDDFDQALTVANDSAFGLSAGICTGSLRHARAFKHGVKAGMVMVNLPTAGVDYHVPFGGTKGSSHGAREQGRHAVEFYTTVKTSYSYAG